MRNKKIYLILLGVIFAILPLFFVLIGLYTEWLFFLETGYQAVFTKVLVAKIGTGVFFGLAFFTFITLNIIIAGRIFFSNPDVFVVNGIIHTYNRTAMEKTIKPLSIIACLVMTFFVGQWGAFKWEEILLYKNSAEIGLSDPIFGIDVGFYLFELPFVYTLKTFAGFSIVLTSLLLAVNYFLRGGAAFANNHFSIDKRVSRHLAIMGGLYIMNIGFGFYLEGFGLLFSQFGVVIGAGYSDVNARLIFFRVLSVITPVSGILFILFILRGYPRLSLIPPAAVFMIYIAGIVMYPSILQKFKVAPNELALEAPYIEHNIKFTRVGYGINKIEVIPFDVDYNLTGKDIEKNNQTIKNIRLWDHTPLLKTYSQLQQIRTYYRFRDVDNDRYMINNEYMQVMLSPRELSYNDLPSKTWINERLIFTHGNGAALGPVSRISKEGLPEFIIKDIPPVSNADLKITRPEIYYGELSNDYVIVNTKVQEFSYPTTDGNVYTAYKGMGGVMLDSLFKKALFSLKFKTEKIFLSSDITRKSKILYYRNIMDRARAIAPFLVFDNDPYIVISDDGRLVWIIDAYTVSGRMPYSTPFDKKNNYIRNSVKVVMDAYNGSVDFYISDPEDVVVKVYSKIFPGLFKPLKDMAANIREHIRYPQRLLQIQASMYAAYHMTDPQVFYNKENLWEIPAFGEKAMEPYYTIMKLPGEQKEEYILLLPYTPAKRDNLAAWLAARCDGEQYGSLFVYTFPRDRLIYGPKQIDARINQDAYISQQLTLWGQRGSQVIMGSMLIIPIENSLLYVQPLYLVAADKAGLPELRRIIVAYENEVLMEETLEVALDKLFGTKKRIDKTSDRVSEEPLALPADYAKEAIRIYERAVEMQRRGNWAGYGEELKKLEQILKKIAR